MDKIFQNVELNNPETDAKIVEWRDEYFTGIKLIDNENMELVETANRLWEKCVNGGADDTAFFKDIVEQVIEYIKAHFSAEEKILAEVNYPEMRELKKEFDSFASDILMLVKEFENGEKLAPNRLARRLRDWVLSHVALSDTKYKLYMEQYLKQNGTALDKT